jgi:PST family polysaccharide transporter
MSEEDRFLKFSGDAATREQLKERSVVSAILTAGSSGVDFVLRFAATLILARLLVPEHFGVVAMVTAITGIAEQFSALGLSTATVQASKLTHAQCSNLFWINAGAGIGFAVLIALCAPLIADFYGDPRLVVITLALSLGFVFGGLTIQHEALLNRQMKQPSIAANRLVAGVSSTGLAVVLAFHDFGYWALVWREVARSAMIAAGTWLLCPWTPGLPRGGARIGRLLRFGRDMTATQFLVGVISRVDGLLVGKFAGPVELGLYRQAHNLMMAPIEQLNGPIFSVAQPGLSMLQSSPERYRRYYERIVFVVSLTTVPLGVFTALYAAEIIRLVLGEKWLDATVFLQIFGIAAALRPTIGTSALVLITCGYSGRMVIASVVHSLALVVCMSLGVGWGAIGIAVAQVLATLLLAPWKLAYSFSRTPVTVRLFLAAVARPLVASAVMAGCLYALRVAAPVQGTFAALALGFAVAVVVYLAAVALIPGGWTQLRSLCQDVSRAWAVRATR